MLDQNLLILERSSANLTRTKDNENYVLEGIFAEFGKENNNNRIYEEDEYLPHLEYLNQKIDKKGLLGELDHPEKFDISLSKVSHIIESITYNKAARTITGRIKLLDTPSGKIAKNLVDMEVPINISSRAAGQVKENKKVKIQRIFTYDIVADPGFENATLKKVNESFGLSNQDKNIAIYEMNNTSYFDAIAPTKKTEPMDYVKTGDMEKYSKHVKNEFRKVYESKKQNTNDDVQRYAEYLAETLENVISYAEHISEKLDNTTSKGSNNSVLNKKVEKLIKYNEYLAEKLDNAISYTEHVEESKNDIIRYAEHISKNSVSEQKLDSVIRYAESISENAVDKKDWDKLVKYAEFIEESKNNIIKYAEHISEGTVEKKDFNKLIEYTEQMFENTKNVGGKILENKSDKYLNTIDLKIESILESAKNKNADKTDKNYPFTKFLTESKKNDFYDLSDAEKNRVSKAIQKNPAYDERAIVKTWDKALSEVEVNEKWLIEMPEKFIQLWENLSTTDKERVIKQSKIYNLSTTYQIKNFWETRGLGETTLSLNESKSAQEYTTVIDRKTANLGYSSEFINSVTEKLKKMNK